MHRGGHNVGFSPIHRVVIRSGHFRAVFPYCCCCTIMEPGQRYILHVYMKGRRRDAFNLIAIPRCVVYDAPCSKQWVLDENYMAVATSHRLFFARRRISLCSHCFKILMREIDIKKSYAWLNILYFLHIIYHFVHFINFGLKILFILTNEI